MPVADAGGGSCGQDPRGRCRRQTWGTPNSDFTIAQCETLGAGRGRLLLRVLCHAMRPLQILTEVVGVNPLHGIRGSRGDTNVMVNHELGELLSVDENDLASNACDVFARLHRES